MIGRGWPPMHTDRAMSPQQADTKLVVQHEVLLGQLHPIEELLVEASREVAAHRASCALAQRTGTLAPGQLARAEAVADGIEEFLRHFAALKAEILMHSDVAEDELADMQRALKTMNSQMDAVLRRLDAMQ